MRIRVFTVIFLFAGGLLSGCAFGDRKAALDYPPVKEQSSGEAQAAPATQAGGTVIVETFSDIREDKTVVGNVRNGFGMKTAKVLPQRDVTDWVREAFIYELEAAGYTVVDGAAAPSGTAAVSGDILRAYCDMYFSYDGQVALRVEANKDGKVLLNQSYTGKGSVGISWAGTGDSFSESLSLALQAALQKVVADFGDLDI